MTAVLFATAFVTVIATDWIRNRPALRERGTQHILFVGYCLAGILLGAGAWFALFSR